MNDWFFLTIEASLDFVALVLAIILIVGAAGNHLRLWWGIMVLLSSSVLLHNNLMWLLGYYEPTALEQGYGLLVVHRMVEWFVAITPAFLYPLATLRPAYLNKLRLVLLLIPVGVVALMAVCYHWFNGYITELNSFVNVVNSIDEFDVRLRLGLFASTLVIPIVYMLIPVLGHFSSVRRRATLQMSIFVAWLLFVLLYYAVFTLFPNRFLFNTYGMVIVVFGIYVSVLHLLYENPLSHRITKISNVELTPTSEIIPPATGEKLYCSMTAYFKTHAPYANPDYTLKEMAHDVGSKQVRVLDAIKNSGFTGFKEYVSYLRVEHFKSLASEPNALSIKELMNASGFTSRSSFYRIFSEVEGTTPSKFVTAARRK